MSELPKFDDAWTIDATAAGNEGFLVRRFELVSDSGKVLYVSDKDRCTVGTDRANDVVLDDRSVSRFHCELHIDERGPRIRDLGSRNGTRVDGVRVQEAWLRPQTRIRAGRTQLEFRVTGEHNRLPLSERSELGTMVGRSVAMRALFAQLERVAPSDVSVLLHGETGTGKEEAAHTLHQLSRRADEPFVVFDCGAATASLLESRLFGHVAGAFTGATTDRVGLFERANGGTIFLDEVAELPLDMQPSLLRVLQAQEVLPVGGTDVREISVRVVAASHRDLRLEVAAGRFREDLFYRLAVIQLHLPPLRERLDDVPLLVERLVESMSIDRETRARLLSTQHLDNLRRAAWPGNVRQLKNHLERAVIFEEPPQMNADSRAALDALVDTRVAYSEARRRIVARFGRAYAERIVGEHDGNVSQAAKSAGVNRTYLHRLLKAADPEGS